MRVLAVLQAVLHLLVERPVEVADHLVPGKAALGHLVERLLHRGREAVVQDVRKIGGQEVGHHHPDVLGQQFLLLGSDLLGFHGAFDAAVAERELADVQRGAGLVALDDVAARGEGADGRGVGGRPADAEFLEFLDQARLAVARQVLGVFLQGGQELAAERLPLFETGQDGLHFFLLVVASLDVDFQESVEEDLLAGGQELPGDGLAADFHIGLLYHGIGHLAGDGPFPDEVVETLFCRCAFDVLIADVGRPDGFVGLLRAFHAGVVVAHLRIGCPVELRDHLLRGAERQ